jgi:hypothetical protein
MQVGKLIVDAYHCSQSRKRCRTEYKQRLQLVDTKLGTAEHGTSDTAAKFRLYPVRSWREKRRLMAARLNRVTPGK